MDLMESLYAGFNASTSVKTATGLDDGGNVKAYPLKAPQDVEGQFFTFQPISGVVEHAMVADDGPRATLVQISSWGATRALAIAVARAARTYLKDFSGVLGGTGGVTVSRIFEETDFMDEFDDAAAEEGLYVVRQDFTVWYEEAA